MRMCCLGGWGVVWRPLGGGAAIGWPNSIISTCCFSDFMSYRLFIITVIKMSLSEPKTLVI